MDSCVTAAIAARNYELAALHASYGQRTARRELECFNALADHFGASRRLVARLGYFAEIGGSSLTDFSVQIHDADLANKSIPNTYVPFRNAHFLAIATSWAEVLGASKIFIGAVCEDSSGYPDCRPEYYAAMNTLDPGRDPARDEHHCGNTIDLASEAGDRPKGDGIGRSLSVDVVVLPGQRK